MKSGLKRILILFSTILIIAFHASCSTNTEKDKVSTLTDEVQSNDSNTKPETPSAGSNIDGQTSQDHCANFHQSYIIISSEEFSPESAPLNNEINDLGQLLTPYLDPENSYFVGETSIDFIKNTLLYANNTNEPISVEDWEILIQLLFKFDEHEISIMDDFSSDIPNTIERQNAIYGLMELLSSKYPLTMDEEYTYIENTNIISDIEQADEEKRGYILQAHYLGFTDYTLNDGSHFRPCESLSKGEAISIICRILNNFGLPALNSTPSTEYEANSGQQCQHAYSVENILSEYTKWSKELKNSNSLQSKEKLEVFTKSEQIIHSNDNVSGVNDPLTIKKWARILNEAFGIDLDRINCLLSYNNEDLLTFDIVSISIFNLEELHSRTKTKEVTDEVLEEIRDLVPQFDTARDTENFAKLYSSGLIEGLYQIPGFTPQRPVNKAETLLLIKRLVEGA